MKLKISLTIIFIIGLSFFFIHSLSNSSNLNSNECDQCHGGTTGLLGLGHISYSISLSMPQIVSNGSSNTLTATILNNNYPLSQSIVSLHSNQNFIFTPSSSTPTLSKSLGILARASKTVVTWNITPVVSVNKTITLQVNFQGTATNHTTFTYQNSLSKSVFVTTAKLANQALLQVESNPVTDSSFLVGQNLGNTTLTIQNTGNAEMKNVTVVTTGNVLVNNQSKFTIVSIAPNTARQYPIELNTEKQGNSSILITYAGSKPVQSIDIVISVVPIPPPSLILVIGEFLGYVTYILLFLSVIAGVGVYHLKKVLSGRKIRILHSDLANLSFTVAIIHGVILSFPSSPWFGTYSWFELLPQVTTTFTSTSQLGLEIGRWTLVIMYIGVISGYFIAKIIKTFGRKVGISIHMLTYLALILGLVHAILIGAFAKTHIIVPVIMTLSIVSVFLLKYEIKFQMAKKKAQRARKNSSMSSTTTHRPKSKSKLYTAPTPVPSMNQQSVSTTSQPIPQLLTKGCKKCKTVNDADAIFCKKCATRLPNPTTR